MHSDSEAVKKSIRTYLLVGAALFVGTVITVAVNGLHLAVPMAIAVALIIAGTKGSLVAGIFMHLNHEKKWIYGSLILTVIFFLVLLFVPILTLSDTFGSPVRAVAAEHAEPAGGGH